MPTEFVMVRQIDATESVVGSTCERHFRDV